MDVCSNCGKEINLVFTSLRNNELLCFECFETELDEDDKYELLLPTLKRLRGQKEF